MEKAIQTEPYPLKDGSGSTRRYSSSSHESTTLMTHCVSTEMIDSSALIEPTFREASTQSIVLEMIDQGVMTID